MFVTSQPVPARNTFTDYLPQNKSFEFHVDCSNVTHVNCTQINQGFEAVGDLIAAEILIKVPILVNVTFDSEAYSPLLSQCYKVETQPAIGNM